MILGCFVNEVPLDLTAIAFEKANKRGSIKCEIEIELEMLGDSKACAVGDFFISRRIEENTLRRFDSPFLHQPFGTSG